MYNSTLLFIAGAVSVRGPSPADLLVSRQRVEDGAWVLGANTKVWALNQFCSFDFSYKAKGAVLNAAP